MQQSMAEWLTASRGRALAAAFALAVPAALVPFGAWLAGALIVLVTLRAAPLPDYQVAAVAAVSFSLVWWRVVLVGPVVAILASAVLLLFPLLLGRLLRRSGSLSFTFQVATLAVLAMLALVHVLIADPPSVWRPFVAPAIPEFDRFAALVAGPDGPKGEEIAGEFVKWAWSEAGWLVLLNAMISVFVGLYAVGRIANRATLGPAFRELKAGRTLSLLALVAFALALFARSKLASDTLWLFVGAFVLQGLALVHAARLRLKLSAGWLVAAYALMFVPTEPPFMQVGLATCGFLDNWFPLRPRFLAQPRT
jgi:hypothetical protein